MSRRLSVTRFLVAAAALSALAAAVVLLRPRPAAADLRTLLAPGPLAEPHAALDGKCESCHVPLKGVPDATCLACHESTAARMRGGASPHARFAAEGKHCRDCHRDHRGRRFQLAPPVLPPFDHRATTFPLSGAHERVACAKCHVKGRFDTPKWADLPRDCAGCHRDPHAGVLGARCGSCHGEAGWKPARHLAAQHRLPMTGGHAGLDCARCHRAGAHLMATVSCGDCHKQGHGGTRAPCASCHNPSGWKDATHAHDFCTCILPGKHQTAPCLGCHPAFKFEPTPLACAGCHTKDRKHEDLGACSRCHSALSWKQRAFDHDKPAVGFAITGRHQEVGCENCHTRKGVFRGAPKKCAGCHDKPAHGDFGPCEKCHTTTGFAASTFTHDRTRFPLDGVHAGVRCRDCHDKLAPGAFVPGASACATCHGNPHGPQFGGPNVAPPVRPTVPAPVPEHGLAPVLVRRVLLAAAPGAHVITPGRGCRDCHTTRAWKPSTIDPARHREMGFVLAGAHERVPCGRCHFEGHFAGTPRECGDCHLDRHGARFGADCRRCHDESSWQHLTGFDHERETRFPLAGAHASTRCAACHGDDSRRLDGVRDIGCATCHDPNTARGHGRQFPGACTSCHQPTRFSDVPPFNHGTTLFPLDRRHAALPCLTCHRADRGARLDSGCRSCHGDPHRGRATLECSDCHRGDNWKIVRFDHDRSEFPLNGRHFTVPCRDCHVGNVFSGLRRECLFCHRGERMRADVGRPSHRMNSFDCANCHNPFKW